MIKKLWEVIIRRDDSTEDEEGEDVFFERLYVVGFNIGEVIEKVHNRSSSPFYISKVEMVDDEFIG